MGEMSLSRLRLNRRDSPDSYRPKRTFHQRWFRDWWLLEFLAVVASCALTVVLCVILYVSDNELVRSFGFDSFINGGVSLSTIVTLLVNLIVVLALYAISECLSQLKWLWYWDQGRPLRDLDTFDQASRGTLGAARLMWKLRIFRNPIASLGAFLTVSQLVIAPLAQQSVVLSEQSIPDPDGAAFLPEISAWRDQDTARSVRMPPGYSRLGHGMKGAILAGLFGGLENPWDESTPFCNTGNCTLPQYESLHMCNMVANETAKLEARNVNSKQVWCMPNTSYCVGPDRDEEAPVMIIGSSAGMPADTYNQTGERDLPEDFRTEPLQFHPSQFKNHTNPIADFYIIYQTLNSSKGVAVMQHMIDWCVLSYSMTTQDDKPYDINGTGGNFIIDFETHGEGIEANMTSTVNGSLYTIDAHTHHTLQRYFQLLFNGSLYYSPSSGFAADNDLVQMFGESLTLQTKDPKANVLVNIDPLDNPDPLVDDPKLKLDPNIPDPAPPVGGGQNSTDGGVDGNDGADGPTDPEIFDCAPDDINFGPVVTHIYYMGLSVSEFMLTRHQKGELAMGMAFITRPVVAVSWGFLSAPIFFALASLNFFIVVAAHGRGQRRNGSRHRPLVWKTSGIATLRGLDANLHRSVGGMIGVSAMDGDASAMEVRLMRDRSGWRLVVDDRKDAPRVPEKDPHRSFSSSTAPSSTHSHSPSNSITRLHSPSASTSSPIGPVALTPIRPRPLPLPNGDASHAIPQLWRVDTNVQRMHRARIQDMV